MTLAHGGIPCFLDIFAVIAWLATTLGGLKALWHVWLYKRHHDTHHKDCEK